MSWILDCGQDGSASGVYMVRWAGFESVLRWLGARNRNQYQSYCVHVGN
jgi:hypothetical protein